MTRVLATLSAGLVMCSSAVSSAHLASEAGRRVRQQSPPLRARAISGIAVDATSGEALAGVSVALTGEGTRSSYSQTTDPKGRFVFVEIPAEATRFTLTGSRPGYLDGFNSPEGAPAGASTPIVLGDGEWMSSARVAMFPPGGLSGRVFDEASQPVVGARVRLLRVVNIQDRSEFATGPISVTDDRGEYRFTGVVPGRYTVSIPSVQVGVDAQLMFDRYLTPPPPRGGRSFVYPTTFYPGTSAATEAQAIDVAYAASRQNVDIRITPVATFRIAGTVSGPTEALTALTLRLLPAGMENLGWGSETATALVGADGRFVFPAVPEGDYVLDAPRSTSELSGVRGNDPSQSLPGPPGYNGSSTNTYDLPLFPGLQVLTRTHRASNSPNYSARTTLSVTSDIAGMNVAVRPMGTVSGRVTFESDANGAAKPLFVQPTLDPASGQLNLGMPGPAARPDANGDFSIEGVGPAAYWVRMNAPGWLLKSATANGQDLTRAPLAVAAGASIADLDIVLTNALPTLSGIVHSMSGHVPPALSVLAFPAAQAMRTNYGLRPPTFAVISVTTDGKFSTTALPAGDYVVVAMSGTPPSDWLRRDFLERAERAGSSVRLEWGRSATIDLQIAEVIR